MGWFFPNITWNKYSTSKLFVSEYPTACSFEARDESMLVFQIEDNNGNVLEDTRDNETQYFVRALLKKKYVKK